MFCVHCGSKHDTEKELRAHRRNCAANSKSVPAKAAKKKKAQSKKAKIAVDFEEIRVTSTSIKEVIDRMIATFKKYGVDLDIHCYPDSWSDHISNSHNSPGDYPRNWRNQDKSKPSGYPGWKGNWSGICPEKNGLGRWDGNDGYFSDITPDWIKTGSGGGVEKFRYGGMLFLYDFPLMKTEWEAHDGRFDQDCLDFNESLQGAHKEHSEKGAEFVKEHRSVIRAIKQEEDAKKLLEGIRVARVHIEDKARQEFHQKNPMEIPKIDSALVDQGLIRSVQTYIDDAKKAEDTDVAEWMEHIGNMFSKIKKFYEAHPDKFI